MAEKLDTLKGLTRGLTADWLGGPVDLATIIANLGIAGVGYGAHKLGLVQTPPDLIDPKNVPFSSDWHVKNSPLENTGSAGYAAGQFTGNLLPGIGALAKGMGAPRKGQTNALYPGGSDDLLLSHATSAENLLPRGANSERNLRRELYHPSWGITAKGDLPNFGDTVVVPNPAKLEPRVSPTVIRAGDFYSPRWTDSKAGGGLDKLIDAKKPGSYYNDLQSKLQYYRDQAAKWPSDDFYPEMVKKMEEGLKNMDQTVRPNRGLAAARLSDRFDPLFPKGGFWGEGAKPGFADPQVNSLHKLRIDQSPHFQSFKHLAESPYGGKIIDADKGGSAGTKIAKLETKIADISEVLAIPGPEGALQKLNTIPNEQFYPIMKGLAGGAGPDMGLLARSPEGQFEQITPENYRRVAEFFQKVLKTLKTMPTEYGEAKTFGPWQMNSDNIAGIISQDMNPAMLDELARAAQARNIPFVRAPGQNKADIFRAAVNMQNNSLYKGMGGK